MENTKQEIEGKGRKSFSTVHVTCEKGNSFFHVLMNKNGTIEPVAHARVPKEKASIVGGLLGTDKIDVLDVTSPKGRQYMFLFDGDAKRPYDSVIIFRYVQQNDRRYLFDVEPEDTEAVGYAIKNYLCGPGRPYDEERHWPKEIIFFEHLGDGNES